MSYNGHITAKSPNLRSDWFACYSSILYASLSGIVNTQGLLGTTTDLPRSLILPNSSILEKKIKYAPNFRTNMALTNVDAVDAPAIVFHAARSCTIIVHVVLSRLCGTISELQDASQEPDNGWTQKVLHAQIGRSLHYVHTATPTRPISATSNPCPRAHPTARKQVLHGPSLIYLEPQMHSFQSSPVATNFA